MSSYKFTDPQIKLMRKAMNSSQFSLKPWDSKRIRFSDNEALEEHLQVFIDAKTDEFILGRFEFNTIEPQSFNSWMVKFSKNHKVKRSYNVYTLDELKFLYIVCSMGLKFNPEKRQASMYKKIIENILTHLFKKVYM